MFNVFIEKRAIRDVERLPQEVRQKLIQKIHSILCVNPFPVGKNPKRLSGICAFRLRVGSYRVLYKISKNRVLVFVIGDRKEVYRDQ